MCCCGVVAVLRVVVVLLLLLLAAALVHEETEEAKNKYRHIHTWYVRTVRKDNENTKAQKVYLIESKEKLERSSK